LNVNREKNNNIITTSSSSMSTANEWLKIKEKRRLEEERRRFEIAEKARKYRAHMNWRAREQRRCTKFAKTPEERAAERVEQLKVVQRQDRAAKQIRDK